ncbi:hypothetical protein [Paenibacillus sp. IHBB 10380]|uniref:hypothetical protein n=1 Tax=Paenibacillus sp. IHBB 10380 TaxID=1566358 RepID=UPI0005CFA6A5|nr:hypothetical protein [Paenibacillus sp. IHBB 10380]AJS59249.1 hypothetical protein UB51_13110 [Paenibacillus sp. IHBB 10380]
MKFILRLINNHLVIKMDNHDEFNFKGKGYTGLPEKFDFDTLRLAPVVGVVEISEEQYIHIMSLYENGGECDWCREIASELSGPHMHNMAIRKSMSRLLGS